jgi:sarcosine oxidase subunit gamma
MVDPIRRLPDVTDSVWLTRMPAAGRFVLNAERAAREACAVAWGTAFSAEPCRAVANAELARAALWLGPDEYLLLDFSAGQHGASLAAELEQAMGDLPHSLVDVGHRQFGIEVHGPHAATILAGSCPLDLDLSAFPVGMCTRTVFAKADITLWRTAEDEFHVEVWRSFSGYVTGVLAEIAAEFYPAAPAPR